MVGSATSLRHLFLVTARVLMKTPFWNASALARSKKAMQKSHNAKKPRSVTTTRRNLSRRGGARNLHDKRPTNETCVQMALEIEEIEVVSSATDDMETSLSSAAQEPTARAFAEPVPTTTGSLGLHCSAEELFDGFVRATARAIEQRDPATSGHSERVAILCEGLAQAVSEARCAPYTDICFSPSQMKELHYAALLHDFGKVAVHEDVLFKFNKLHGHELELLRMRFELVRTSRERDLLQRKYDVLIKAQSGAEIDQAFSGFAAWDGLHAKEVRDLDDALRAVAHANNPLADWVSDSEFKVHRNILSRLCHIFFWDRKRNALPLLSDHELRCLSVRQGSLNENERRQMERHVTHTWEFLKQIPWTNEYSMVPQIAYCHHERCDGTGYPQGLECPDIPLQSRILTVCDIYDALAANDRPYKRPRTLDEAMEVLRSEVDAGCLDGDLATIFIDCGVWKRTLGWRNRKSL